MASAIASRGNIASLFNNYPAVKMQDKGTLNAMDANKQSFEEVYTKATTAAQAAPLDEADDHLNAAQEIPHPPTQITIYAQPEPSLSPYQQRMEKPYEVVNDDFFEDGSSSLKAVLDTVNPLQQIPVVGTIYRELTGDTISTGSRLAGGMLLGGPIGFALALVNEIVSGVSGKDIGANLYAAVNDKYKDTDKLA